MWVTYSQIPNSYEFQRQSNNNSVQYTLQLLTAESTIIINQFYKILVKYTSSFQYDNVYKYSSYAIKFNSKILLAALHTITREMPHNE